MIQEIKDLFTVTLAKRLTSPFISTFMFAWCVTNYDITLLVFSGNDWNTKVSYISGLINSSSYITYRSWSPLAISFFYLSLWPLLDMQLYKLSKKWSIKYKALQMKMEEVTPITPEERKEIEDKLNKIINEFREEIVAKESKISEIETRYKIALEISINKDQELSDLNGKINDQEQEISGLKSELSGFMVGNKTNVPPSETEKTPEVINKAYSLPYHVSDVIKKKESLNGKPITGELYLQFNRSEIDDDIFKAFHTVNYNASKGGIMDGYDVRINLPTIDDTGRKVSDTSFWTLEKSPSGLTAVEILNIWYSDYQTNNGAITEDEKSSASTVLTPKLLNSKKYIYTYRVAQNILKEGARHEVNIDPVQSLTFTRSDLNDDVYNALFDLYYDKATNKMRNKQELITKQYKIVDEKIILNNNSWEITINPKELSPTEILDLWYQELTKANSNIENIQVQLDKKNKQAILNKQQDDERIKAIKARL
jgi:hypothetical protein